MSEIQERIAQFRNMALNDPDNELGHFRLGQLLQEAGQHEDAEQSFRRTLELSPQFSKVYQLLGQSLLELGKKDEAITTLKKGFEVADERGDNMPRDAMGKMLSDLGEEVPQSQQPQPQPQPGAEAPRTGEGGFPCQSPQCMMGGAATQLPEPPMKDELGQQIYEKVCAGCWSAWVRDYSIKVINELHLNLSDERGQEAYDSHMKQFLGLQ